MPIETLLRMFSVLHLQDHLQLVLLRHVVLLEHMIRHLLLLVRVLVLLLLFHLLLSVISLSTTSGSLN